jgi:hypothetical protein
MYGCTGTDKNTSPIKAVEYTTKYKTLTGEYWHVEEIKFWPVTKLCWLHCI